MRSLDKLLIVLFLLILVSCSDDNMDEWNTFEVLDGSEKLFLPDSIAESDTLYAWFMKQFAPESSSSSSGSSTSSGDDSSSSGNSSGSEELSSSGEMSSSGKSDVASSLPKWLRIPYMRARSMPMPRRRACFRQQGSIAILRFPYLCRSTEE